MKLKLLTLALMLFSFTGYTSATYSNFIDNETSNARFTAYSCEDDCDTENDDEPLTPEVALFIDGNQTKVGFVLNNVTGFNSFDYTIIVTHDNEFGETQDAIVGTIENAANNSTILKENIALGTCSTETCVYYENISQIKLTVDLLTSDVVNMTLTDALTF